MIERFARKLNDIASMRDSEIKHCQSWREHYYATEAEIKRRGKVTVKPPQRIDMHEAIVAERCETFVSKEMARMPVPLKMIASTYYCFSHLNAVT